MNGRISKFICISILLLVLSGCNAGNSIQIGEDSMNSVSKTTKAVYRYRNDVYQPYTETDIEATEYKTADNESADDANVVYAYIEGEFKGDRGKPYSGVEEFLKAFSLEEAVPFYEYYDINGNLQMTFYYDEETKKGCGIRYIYSKSEDSFLELVGTKGFVFEGFESEKWEEPDIYSVKSIDGYDGSSSVKNYNEETIYDKEGRITSFLSTGILYLLGEEEKIEKVININFEYRENGTLMYKDYWHHALVFGSYGCSIDSFYDERERVLYEDVYITHGSYDFYYIYTDDSRKPAYCLWLDNNIGVWVPTLIRYE